MKKEETAAMERRYARLAARLARTGLVLQGSIAERTIVRPDPGAQGKEKAYGPYWQWTFKRGGKTVTVNLGAGQARTYRGAIERNRALEETVAEMRALSLRILEARTKGVKKRKSKE